MKTTTGKEIKKYIGFNPSSSNPEEWFTANSLREVKNILWAGQWVNHFTIKKINDGSYICENIDIYEVSKHPKTVEGLE